MLNRTEDMVATHTGVFRLFAATIIAVTTANNPNPNQRNPNRNPEAGEKSNSIWRGILNPKHATHNPDDSFAISFQEYFRNLAAIETGIAVKKKNHTPAARTRGRNGLVPTNPNLEW